MLIFASPVRDKTTSDTRRENKVQYFHSYNGQVHYYSPIRKADNEFTVRNLFQSVTNKVFRNRGMQLCIIFTLFDQL